LWLVSTSGRELTSGRIPPEEDAGPLQQVPESVQLLMFVLLLSPTPVGAPAP
jgi:hypothetical protein